MSTYRDLILAIAQKAEPLLRILHIENCLRASLTRDVPHGTVTSDVTAVAASNTFSVPVDTTAWMAVGQRLVIVTPSSSQIYVSVNSITSATLVVFTCLQLIGITIGEPIDTGSKIVIGSPPQEVIGHVVSGVGSGWVKNSGTWSPVSSTANVVATFNGRTSTVVATLNTVAGTISLPAYVGPENDISYTLLNNGTTNPTIRFTDLQTGAVREYTLFAIVSAVGAPGLDGADGLDGVSILNQGQWAPGVNYYSTSAYKSAVYYDGGLYIAKLSNIDKEPISAQSDTYWDYLGVSDSVLAPTSWDFVKEYNGLANRGYVRPLSGQFEIGSNEDIQEFLVIDTVAPLLSHTFGETLGSEDWFTHGLRWVFSGSKSPWALFPFKGWAVPGVFPTYFEGKHRLITGETGVWQNLDGGGFITPIGASQVNVYSFYAERIYGSGGFEVGVFDWGGTQAPIQVASASGPGYVTVPFTATSIDHLYVRVPTGTAYRFSVLLRHTPD